MLGGLPTPLDPFEARRIVLTLLLLSACGQHAVAVEERRATAGPRGRGGARIAAGRRHVRPPRGC